jgi:hypothetical protein
MMGRGRNMECFEGGAKAFFWLRVSPQDNDDKSSLKRSMPDCKGFKFL